MKSPWFRSGVLGPVVALMWASGAGAQPIASSLEDVRALVGANPNVTVTDTSGQEFRGTITDAAESGLSLRSAGATRRFQAADVRTIRVRTPDSLVNGALIGAAIGGGLTSLYFLDNECHDDPACDQAVAVYGGIGALAGLGIDALIHRNVVVYTSPTRGARPAATLAPMIARGRKGIRVTVAF